MRLSLILIALSAFSMVNNCVHSQELTKKLLTEDPAKLAAEARANGDIVRGAILFHQGNINCAKCHRPTAEVERFGPDLSRTDRDVTDQFLVESILQPSKEIKKGFEPIIALTLDGELVNGILVKQDEEKVVLRDKENVDRLITVLQSNLDELRNGTISSMPAGLADNLKNRQQFLDLVRYVIDVKERGPEVNANNNSIARRQQLSPELKGQVLINELNCIACHPGRSFKGIGSAKQAPDLNWSGKSLNPQYIARFIANPLSEKPGAKMPHMLGHLGETARQETAEAIMHFLVSRTDNTYSTTPVSKDSVARGSELFHAIGCVACHAPRNAGGEEESLRDSKPLGDLSDKYDRGSLVEFLENPTDVRPSGRMPKMNLTHAEAIDLSSFLLQNASQESVPFQVDSRLATEGKQLFGQLNCASCHSDVIPSQPALSQPLDQLNPRKGCLGEADGLWPEFQLNDEQKNQIRLALAKPIAELSDSQRISISLETFNCTACHSRGDLGGVTPERNPHFQTTNLNLGEQGRIPPTLTNVGAKLKQKWMRDVMVNARTTRPYMKTRMPQFGEPNIGHLIELLQKSDKLPPTNYATFDDQKEIRKYGHQLVGNKGLNCVACHTYQYKLSDTMPAVDLTEMSERLKKDWFYQYMKSPQSFSPNTVMPSFWPGGVAIRKDLEGNSDYQIEAIWQYLLDGRQASTPSGVVREPLEIVVTNEAQMLRRSYPGIGKRGIGVGYPGGMNIAYDAEQMRLGMIWNGKFVDPSGVWRGQGHGNVRPMSRPVNFAKGPELDDAAAPWVPDEGRPPKHQFRGYSLDPLRRPTFKYQFEDIEIRDHFVEENVDEKVGQQRLVRTITMSSLSNRKGLRFRIADDKEIKKMADGVYQIGRRLKVILASELKRELIDTPDGKRLQVTIDIAAKTTQKLTIEYLLD